MGNLKLRWVPKANNSLSIDNTIVAYIRQQQLVGIPRSTIIDTLIKRGTPFIDIQRAFKKIGFLRKHKHIMDWRSPTAINATGRLIRNDVRKGKVSYSLGMTVLIRARNTLKTLIKNPFRDRRLAQINYEIKTTKNLLAPQFADKKMMMHYGNR